MPARCRPDQNSKARLDMNISLNGRAAIVTGGSKGIGFAIATRFATDGGDVAIVGRGREALDAAVKQIGTTATGRVIGVQGDVGTAAGVRGAYAAAIPAYGELGLIG